MAENKQSQIRCPLYHEPRTLGWCRSYCGKFPGCDTLVNPVVSQSLVFHALPNGMPMLGRHGSKEKSVVCDCLICEHYRPHYATIKSNKFYTCTNQKGTCFVY